MKRFLFATVLSASLLIPAGFGADDPAKIHNRKERQQGRIAQGVASGQLTPGETTRLEKRESNINKEVRRDRVANGGNLTNKEKSQVNRQQNRVSRSIYRDKHNAKTQQ